MKIEKRVAANRCLNPFRRDLDDGPTDRRTCLCDVSDKTSDTTGFAALGTAEPDGQRDLADQSAPQRPSNVQLLGNDDHLATRRLARPRARDGASLAVLGRHSL